jgi:yeast amino acid transporter
MLTRTSGVIVYGELEFWLALWKIICVCVGFLLAILCNTGAIGGDYVGFRYWKEPGAVINGINGFGQSFVLAAVYYCGTELVAITAGESKRPNKDIPKVRRSRSSNMAPLLTFYDRQSSK